MRVRDVFGEVTTVNERVIRRGRDRGSGPHADGQEELKLFMGWEHPGRRVRSLVCKRPGKVNEEITHVAVG